MLVGIAHHSFYSEGFSFILSWIIMQKYTDITTKSSTIVFNRALIGGWEGGGGGGGGGSTSEIISSYI